MAYELTAFNEELWAREMQQVFFKENRAIALANTELRDLLSSGDKVQKPYRSHLVVKDYTRGGTITSQDVSGLEQTLTVNTAKIVPFYVDDIDKIQNKWDMAAKYAQDAQRLLNNVLDQTVLGEYSVATSDIYNADVGGAGATTAIPLTTSNIFNIFTSAGRKLDYLNMPTGNRFAVLSPRALEVLRLSIAGRETGVGDIVGDNGKIGNRFGFELYESNNCAFGATWTPTACTATDTLSIAGVTFTFSDTPTAAGEVDSSGNVAASLALLVDAINGTGTPGATTYVAVSDANRWKLTNAGVFASENDTVLTIVGYGDIVLESSEVDSVWAAQVQHLLFGNKGSTDLLVQKAPNVEFRKAEKLLGKFCYPWMLYGYLTFYDMRDGLIDVNIDASSWV